MFSEKEDLRLRLRVTAREGLGTGAHTDLLAAAELQNSALFWNSTNQGPKRGCNLPSIGFCLQRHAKAFWGYWWPERIGQQCPLESDMCWFKSHLYN